MSKRSTTTPFGERAQIHENSVGATLLNLMERKKTNLCIAADLTTKQELLALANAVGPHICLLKTHIDIVRDFDYDLVDQLTRLALQHDFLIFEDRKFADIGNTVRLQYGEGVHRIVQWAHLIDAHTLPGDGIVRGLKEVGVPFGRGLILLAQMSSANSLFTPDYTAASVEMARAHTDFVVGFVTGSRLTDGEDQRDFIHFTPGVSLSATGDALGQQYRTPRQAVLECGTDVVIVGRGIYGAADPAIEAKRYRDDAWQAYCERVGNITEL
ncbi:orotidine-5'-phosphate decarboxylase [Syncephalis fuscata]|nr:orotidine-5'-phosphate decarboxylase [Syncephalis fuscata]